MPRTEQEIMTNWEFMLGEEPNDEDFKSISLPHDWVVDSPFNKQMKQGAAQGYRDRWGIGWYRRKLDIQEKKVNHKYFLDFGGVFENSTVWINGTEAGGHKYGYSSFRLDVTDLLKQGDNIIKIKVDNSTFPVDRWYSGSGIYRTVKLIGVENQHFDEMKIVVQTKRNGSNALVIVDTGINDKVKAKLSNCETTIDAESGNGQLELTVNDVHFWSAEDPNLYTLTICLMDGERVKDTVSMQIGIREVSFVPNKGLFVNGRAVKLKGVCVHQDVGCRGIAAKKELWRERLSILKEMGCNALRPSHHTFSTEFLDLCDEMGFYVYEEAFDKWTSGLYGRYFHEHWKEDIDCMVKRDRNRACIIIWGTGNEVENQGQESMVNIQKMLRTYINELDDTRPVTYAMNPHFKRESNIDASKVKDIQQFVDVADDYEIYDMQEKLNRIKRVAENVDIISCNYQEQWYEDIHKACPNKLILGTEVYQFFKGHSDQMQNFTNENPSLVPLENDYVIGSMIWTGYDYLGESMGYPAKGWSGALIRTNNEKRFSYYIFQSYWNEKPMVHFSVMDYSLEDEGVKEHWDIPMFADHWHFPQFNKTVIPYAIASNCDEVALYLNEKRFFLAKPSDCPNRLITGFLPYMPGVVRVIGYRDGIEVCSQETVTPSTAVSLRFNKDEIGITAEKNHEMLLTVRATDENGNPCFRESGLVRFRVTGDAEILAVDNGNLMGNEPYNEEFIHMYRGCASVLIRINEGFSRIVVYADASGLRTGSIIIGH